MTTVTLSALLDARNESLRVPRASGVARVQTVLRALSRGLRPVFAGLVIALAAVAGFTFRHGLVLAGCAALVVGAATLSITAAWVVAAGSLFFLEARRR